MNEHTVPAQVNVLAERETCKRMRVPWTPYFLFVDGDGVEQHRFQGFLPPDEFVAQIRFAAAKDAFGKGQYEKALREYTHVVEKLGATDAAPESLYWIGVCEFKLDKKMDHILQRCREVAQRWPDHIMAKKLRFV